MLLAYIDEIGEPGAFISREHPRFNTSPAFGYAGFVIPALGARPFSGTFSHEKHALFHNEISGAEHPGRWERKGSDMLRPDTPQRFPQHIRVFNSLVRNLRSRGGSLFYYADEKPLGTPAQTKLDTIERETGAMRETLNRIARHADLLGENVMIIIDQVNEKTRKQRLPRMYEHIFGRASEHPEMRRIIEPPMHVDSVLSSNVQFADWVAACVTRAIDYQTSVDSPYSWLTEKQHLSNLRGAFTHESKLRLWRRSIVDLNHSDILKSERPLHPTATGQLLSRSIDPTMLRRIKTTAERSTNGFTR